MTFGAKLTAASVAMTVSVAALGLMGLMTMRDLNDSYTKTIDRTGRALELSGATNTAVSDLFAAQRGVLVSAFLKEPPRLEAAKAQFREKQRIFEQAFQDLRPLLDTEEGRRLAENVDAKMAAWLGAYPSLAQLCDEGKPEDATRYAADRVLPLYQDVGNSVSGLIRLQQQRLAADKRAAADEMGSVRFVDLFALLVCVAIGVSVLIIVRKTSRRIIKVSSEVDEGAGQVASAAGQVASASQGLAQGANEQAASLEETSASTEEITSMTRKNAENSQSVAKLMQQSSDSIGEVNHALEDMVRSMGEINDSSEKISKIIKVIDEIAFQTNILALNAAVEAARAGEAGMGFAVVADEVGNLAQRCAQAARDTSGLIEESISKVTQGSGKLDGVSKALRKNFQLAGQMKTLVDEVNVGSQEQARGMEQIATSVAQMEQVTQQTAAHAEQSASASEELSALADRMKTSVDGLLSMVAGTAGSAVQRRPQAAALAVNRSATLSSVPSRSRPKPKAVFEKAPQRPAITAARIDRSAIPLEGEFKEIV